MNNFPKQFDNNVRSNPLWSLQKLYCSDRRWKVILIIYLQSWQNDYKQV